MISIFKIDDRRINAGVIREYGPATETGITIQFLQGKALNLTFPDKAKRDEILNVIDGAMGNIQQFAMPQVWTTRVNKVR